MRLQLESYAKSDALTFGFVPDFSGEEFDFFRCVNWTHLIFFGILEVFLISKCIIEKLQQALIDRNKLISVEVLDQDSRIDRKKAKKNLDLVIRVSRREKQKVGDWLFDKTWYQRRAAVHKANSSENGFVLDKWGAKVLGKVKNYGFET